MNRREHVSEPTRQAGAAGTTVSVVQPFDNLFLDSNVFRPPYCPIAVAQVLKLDIRESSLQ